MVEDYLGDDVIFHHNVLFSSGKNIELAVPLLAGPGATALADSLAAWSREAPTPADRDRASLVRVRRAYLDLAEREPERFVVVDCSQEIEAVQASINMVAGSLLNDK